jgi:hypothetical protein
MSILIIQRIRPAGAVLRYKARWHFCASFIGSWLTRKFMPVLAIESQIFISAADREIREAGLSTICFI